MIKITCFILILFMIFCTSCASMNNEKAVCRHTSVMCGLVFSEKYKKVLISYGPMTDWTGVQYDWLWHSQAKVLINNKWEWIQFSNIDQSCFIGEKDMFVETDNITIEKFIKYVIPHQSNNQ